ncbi:SDR family NAD(P)-dependent oxidoreductase [Opitutus terrae]|uniref:Short-chain dehydrogenase/reductase SDR n=1 Tax=Opitutus terrae (strain DSM 11246 / JCM 15787 / PB90-1) TaxID=452637 RepID=B1ZYR9_OPITP|nr:SDR family oxidoreductase [Opitutus terrae]ACB75305.1 short-chain dehydrogenase/reductase SDR [Opitutus terrae PB90-1]
MNSLRALVTGGSRGIGRAIAQQLAARSCRVAVHYRDNHTAAEATLASLAGQGHIALAADIGCEADAERLWNESVGALGGIDILVNNAGVFAPHPPLTTDLTAWQDSWRRTLSTNLMGPATLSYLAARAMAGRELFEPRFGRGRIVNVSSRGAFRGEPKSPAYGASKAGLNALSQSLAKALAPQAVYVYCLAPGWVETDMAADHLTGPDGEAILADHPLGRVATVEEIARTAAFCALDAPAAMTGCIVDINGASYLRT